MMMTMNLRGHSVTRARGRHADGGSRLMTRLMTRLSLLACVLAAPASSWALEIKVGSAVRTPSTPAENSFEVKGVSNGLVELNPSGAKVLSERGFESVTRVSVDGNLGLIKGSTSLNLDRQLDSGSPVTAVSTGMFVFAAPLLGGGGAAEVPITVQLSFDGAFHHLSGDPMMVLLGTMSAGTHRGGMYGSSLTFWQAAGGPVRVERSSLNSTGEAFAGAQPLVQSQTAEHLAGVARVSFMARPGDVVGFSGALLGSVTAAYDANQHWQPSSGTVDFLNTGRLSILLPQGYSLDSEAPLLRNVVQTVPEPGSWALMGAGLALLLGLRRPKRGG